MRRPARPVLSTCDRALRRDLLRVYLPPQLIIIIVVDVAVIESRLRTLPPAAVAKIRLYSFSVVGAPQIAFVGARRIQPGCLLASLPPSPPLKLGYLDARN